MTSLRQKLSTLYSSRRWLLVIIIVGIGLKIPVAFHMGDEIVNLPGIFDQVSYDMIAQQILAGQGFTVAQDWWPATLQGEPTAHWSYLYSLYLAAVYGLVGHHPLIARLIQVVVTGVLLPLLLYRLGRRYFNENVGLISAGLSICYIYFTYYTAALVTESFYIVSILWVIDLTGQLSDPATQDKKSSRLLTYGFLLGIALAITVLLRQVFLLFIPILFVWLLGYVYFTNKKRLVQTVGILTVASLILVFSILPWTYRNYQAFGKFVLLNTNAGFAFYWGNHPIHGYDFISILPDDGPSYRDLIPQEYLKLNEAELDQALLKEAFFFIQNDPIRYIVLSMSRSKDYFMFWPSSESSLLSNLSRVFSFGLLLPFMVYGLFREWNFSSNRLVLYLFVVAYTGIHLLSWALIRYRLPVDAILIIFAGAAMLKIAANLPRRHLNRLDWLEYKSVK